MKTMQALLLLLCITAASSETLQIFSASTFLGTPATTLSGSLEGGRTLYIQGVGFPSNPTLLQVWVGNYPCKIPADGVTPTALSCETTSSFSLVDVKSLTIKIISQGQIYTVPSTTYNYLASDTPSITNVYPGSSIGGTRLNFYARHRVLNVGDGLRDMGDFLGIYVGGTLCSMFDISQDAINYNSVTRALCDQAVEQQAGRYNVTQHVVAGWAFKEYTMRKPSLSKQYYEHTVVPAIYELSTSSGFDTGQTLQIFGSGFSSTPSKASVKVDGVTCDILSSTLSQIDCRLRARQVSDSGLINTVNSSLQTKGYLGGSGFTYSRYDITALSTKNIASFRSAVASGSGITLIESKTMMELETLDLFGSNYGQVFKGYFYAPVDGNYTFRGAADDAFTLLMNPVYGTSSGTLDQVIFTENACSSTDNYYISNHSTALGTPRFLEGGKYYYTQVYHINGAGSGWLKISVQVPNNDTTMPKQTFQVNHIETTFTNDPQFLSFTVANAYGGTFNLSVTRISSATLLVTYTKQVTINLNSTASQFQTAINQFDSYSSAGTTCVNATAYDAAGNVVSLIDPAKVRTVWVVQVNNLRTTAQLAERFKFKPNNLLNVTGTSQTWTQTTLQNHCPLISGTFTLDIGGQSIKIYDTTLKTYSIFNIPYNVAAGTLQAALRQIVGFEKVEVYQSGSFQYGTKWIISFIQYFGDVPNMVISGSKLAGGLAGTYPQIAFYETRKYSSNIFFNPINEQLMFTAASNPQVVVTVNNVESVCITDCSYTFINTVPLITSQTKTGASVSVTISDPVSSTYANSALTVKVDGQICTITTGSYPSFTCTLPTNTNGSPKVRAGYYNVEVFIAGRGFVGVQNTTAQLFYDLVLNTLTPNTGGTNGGYNVDISGAGFPSDISLITVSACGTNAYISSTTNTLTKILIPKCTTASSTPVSYTYNSITKSLPFSYTTSSVSASIQSISPSSYSPVQKGVMTITGTGFNVPVGDVSVFLSNATGKIYKMRVLSTNASVITCGIPGGLVGNYFVEVSIAGVGAVPPVNNTVNLFAYQLVVTSVSPTSGPYYGGTLVTINGSNFSPDLLQTLISVGNQLNTLCAVQTVSRSQITCRMPATHPDWTSATQQVIITNKIIQDSTCPNTNCSFTYSTLADSPNITKISASSSISGTTKIILTGTKFNTTIDPTLVRVVLENKLTGVRTVTGLNTINQTHINFTVPNVTAGGYNVRVRFDTYGQTNSVYLVVKAVLSTNAISTSINGGSALIAGLGLPTSWPSKLWTLTATQNSIPIAVQVLSTSLYTLQVKIPPNPQNTATTISLKDPLQSSYPSTLTQTAASTPTVSITSSLTLTAGVNSVQLNRTNLNTKQAKFVKIYNVNSPDTVYDVGALTYNGTFVQFNYGFKAGRYGVKVWVLGYGYATVGQFINVTATAAYVPDNYNVSINGGRIILNGTDISPDATLTIGGYTARVVQTSTDYSIFQIPPLVTSITATSYPQIAKQQTIVPAAIISDGGSNAGAAFDKLQSSYYSSTAAVCYIGLDVGVGRVVNVGMVRYFPYYKWAIAAMYIKGAVIEGSTDGTAYTTIATIDQTVHSGWNSIKTTLAQNYRYIRLKHTSLSGCKLSQFQIVGTIYNDVPVLNTTIYTTDAYFNDGLNSYNFNSSINYMSAYTPIVTDISPSTISVYGGEVVNFTGVGFSLGLPQVSVDGVQCTVNVSTVTDTFFACVTGSRLTLPAANSFVVRIGDQNPVLRDQLFYVMRWSDVKTWGTDLPPVQGDLIYIPKGMTLFVDQSTPRLDGIIVQDAKIIFSDQIDMQIHTNFITVNRGQFRAGTQTKPYQHKLTFIMYGNYYGKQQPMFGNKGIGCMQCKFSMHGIPKAKTWTLLAATVAANTATLTTQDIVDWSVGDEIVVASTGYDHNEAQQRRITSITGNTITVDKPFVYQHLGIDEMYGTNKLQLRAQVGLLTRNIKMMGDPTSEASLYGSHLMMAGRAENGLVAHIAYTEFTHCGQPKIVGRYCMHFHMNGQVPDSYAKGNAVHHSFARVITIHGVHYLRITENVGYRVRGHNFFVEDGIETHNLIEKNLAIGSLAAQNMMQTDMSVASFWITNPTNDVRFNRAAGGDFYGFWYEIKPNPDGPSSTTDVCPVGNPLGESHDNVAHSYKRFGLRIFKLYSRQIPCKPIRDDTLADPWSTNPSIQSRFYNYMAYKNGQSGLLAEETGNMIFENFTIAESKLAGMEFYRANLTRELVQARDMAIICHSPSSTADELAYKSGARGVIGPRTSGWKMSNIRFYNFPATTTVIQTCSKCDSTKLYTNTAQQYDVSGITMTNVTGPYLFMKGQKRQIIYDLDASLSSYFDAVSRTSATIVWKFKHLEQQTSCRASNATARWDNALSCDQTITIRKVMFTNLQNQNLFNNAPMKVQKIIDETQVVSNVSTLFTEFYSLQSSKEPMIDKEKSYAMAYVTDRVYSVWWLTGIDFTHVAMDVSKRFQDSDRAIVFKFKYTQNREIYEIGHFMNGAITTPLIAATSPGPLDRTSCNFGDYTHNNDIGVLTLCASSRGKIRTNQYLDVNGIKCRYLCPSPAGQFIKEKFIRLWSNTSQWPENRLPAATENVTIPGNWTILMDISPAEIDFWLVDGDVIIPQNVLQTNISAKFIWVRAGSIRAGISGEPHPGKVKITLLGNKQDRGRAINQFIGGNKFFAVHGRVELYGTSPANVWTRAKATVRPGATTISVTSAIADWQAGDKIVIGPTFKDPSQHQEVTIVSVNSATNTITFTPALNFTHFGASGVTVNNAIGTLDTRAAVGHLTRNIQIVSGSDQGWGFHMIVQGYNDGDRLRTGSVVLQGVEFLNGGQYDTENTALKLQNTVGTENVQISKSSFHYCKSYCLDITNINNALVQNNVFYNARVKHVRALKLNSFSFKNNLMISVIHRPTVTGKELITCYETYQPIHESSVSITSNLCQGSDLHGFVLPFIPCDLIASSPYSDNTAGSATIGFIFNSIQQACQAASGIKAYACQIGQICSPPGTEKIMFDKFMVVDSGRGVTLRFGKEGDDRTAFMSNSYISAISRPSCTECYGTNAIDCTGNQALRMLTVTVNGQHLPKKFGTSFDVVCKQQVFDAKAFLENVIFDNYRQTYPTLSQCTNNVIFKPHSGAMDLTGSHHLKNVVCNGCETTALAYFTPPNPALLTWFGGCGSIFCTGNNNYIIQDHTGNLLGFQGTLLANNSVIGDNTANCTFIPQINGHICRRTDFGVLEYESIAPDFNTRIMWPVYLKFDGGNWNTTTNGWRQWQWQGNQPLNKRLGRFISTLQLNQTYNMTFESQPPIDLKLQFQQKSTAGNPQNWIVVKLFYPRPNSIRVSNRFGTVKPITLLDNNGENPLDRTKCGSNKYFYQNYTVHFVVTADKSCQVRVSLTNSIQLNARIDMDINAFFAADGQTKFIDRMCAVLGITDTSRVKIVGVYSGSVELVVVIDEPAATTPDNATQANNTQSAQSMTQLQQLISNLNSNGSLGSALTSAGLGPLLNLHTQIYYHTDDPAAPEPEKQQAKVSSVAIGLIVGIVVGVSVIVAASVAGCMYFMRKRAQVTQIFEMQVSEQKKINNIVSENESVIDFKKN